jgi:CheY-like chemotaxis protein
MAAPPSQPEAQHQRTILIADYALGTIVPLRYLMEQCGYRVLIAPNGQKALQLIQSHRPDLVLLEAMIADPDGFEVCQRVRQDPDLKHTPIIFVSAMTREIDVDKAMALGAAAYIKKPFSNSEIMDNVRKLLELSDGPEQ